MLSSAAKAGGAAKITAQISALACLTVQALQKLGPVIVIVAEDQKIRIQQRCLGVIPQWLQIERGDLTTGLFDDALRSGAIPLRGRAKAWIQVCLAFGDQAELERAADRLGLHRFHALQ